MVAGIVPAHHKEKEIQSQGFITFCCIIRETKLYVPVGNEPVTLGGSKESNIMLYTSGKIGKIHALVFRLEKDGDLYISPANVYCRVYVNNKEINGPTLLSHKTQIEIDSQYLKFEKIPVVKVDEPQKTASDEISSTASINETPNICSEDKVTEVIESNLEDHNENDTPIPDINENETTVPETALPYKTAGLTPEQSVPTTRRFDSGASVPTLSPSYSLGAPPETPAKVQVRGNSRSPPSSPNIKKEDAFDKTRSDYQQHCARLLSLLADGDQRPLVAAY